MRKILLLSLLLISSLYAVAQNSALQKLQQELAKHPQQDTIYLHRIAHFIFYDTLFSQLTTEQKDSLHTVRVDIARKLNNTDETMYALVGKAYFKAAMYEDSQATALAQQAYAMSVKANNKWTQENALFVLGEVKQSTNPQEGMNDLLKAETIAESLPDKDFLVQCQSTIGDYYNSFLHNSAKSMEWLLKALNTAKDVYNPRRLKWVMAALGALYSELGDYNSSLSYLKKAQKISDSLGTPDAFLQNILGNTYLSLKKYPEAIAAYKKGLAGDYNGGDSVLHESNLANVYLEMNNLPLTFSYGFNALKRAQELNYHNQITASDNILASAYLKKNRTDSALYYATKGFDLASKDNNLEYIEGNSETLADIYVKKEDYKNAYKYYVQFIKYRDSISNVQVANKASMLEYNYNLEKTKGQIASINAQKKNQQNILIASLIVLGLIIITAIMLLRNNRQKIKANKQLQQQKQKVESTLSELRSTQAQLIQSEKMASLGELTAGIAHEIQNPLNFVNNFSEVSNELVDEMKDELATGNMQLATEIADDLKQNLEKINHHGKRADAIVKGMLQHSRQSTGVKEPANINAIADECMRLSYHGLRAKDKSFNADLQTNFDESIDKILLIQQDIVRVLINLFNNAFYAVAERQKAEDTSYKPTVGVSTKKINDKVEIKVADNGNGIPQNIIDKIFQPFFTTKPTGQGTGLGLSLAYDIITKEHGGTIKVESK
jgi:signal transduction histidine kinase